MSYQVKTPWVKAIRVTPLDDYQLKILLENSQEMVLDLKDLIASRENYWRLQNPRYFCQVNIDPLGGICWSEGEDLAPDGLERYAIKD